MHPVRPAGATSGCQLPAALSPSPRSLHDHIRSSREGRAGLLPAARGRSRGPSGRGELRVPPQGGGTGSLLSPAQRRQRVGVLGPCKSTTRALTAPQSPTGWANLARAEGELPLPEHRPLRAFSPSTGARHTPSPQPSAAGQQNQAPLPRHEQHEGTQRAQGHPSTESCPHEKLRLCVTGAVPETQAGSDHTCLKPTALRRDGSPARLCRRCLLRGVSAGCWPRRGDQPGARCPSCSSSGSTSSRCSGAGPLACSSWLGSAACSCPSAQRQREGEQSEGAAHIPVVQPTLPGSALGSSQLFRCWAEWGTCGFGSLGQQGCVQQRARWLTGAEERLHPGAGSSQNVSVFINQLPPSLRVPGWAHGVKPATQPFGSWDFAPCSWPCGDVATPPCWCLARAPLRGCRPQPAVTPGSQLRDGTTQCGGCSETSTPGLCSQQALCLPCRAGSRHLRPEEPSSTTSPRAPAGPGEQHRLGGRMEVLNCGSGVASVSACVCKDAWESFVGSRPAATLRHSQLGSKSWFMVRRL